MVPLVVLLAAPLGEVEKVKVAPEKAKVRADLVKAKVKVEPAQAAKAAVVLEKEMAKAAALEVAKDRTAPADAIADGLHCECGTAGLLIT